jgi:hypothetical protein
MYIPGNNEKDPTRSFLGYSGVGYGQIQCGGDSSSDGFLHDYPGQSGQLLSFVCTIFASFDG